jgi:drug/metabolite transporter (DMT)-like permease
VLLWVVPALWSSNYLIARASEGVIGPHLLALGRWVLAILLLLPFTWAVLARVEAREAVRREWPQMLALGALGMWVCGAFVYLGGHTTSSNNIALIYAATPIAIVYAGSRLLHEPMSRAQWVGVWLALAGVLFVISRGEPRTLLEVRFTVGDGWRCRHWPGSWRSPRAACSCSCPSRHWRPGSSPGRPWGLRRSAWWWWPRWCLA